METAKQGRSILYWLLPAFFFFFVGSASALTVSQKLDAALPDLKFSHCVSELVNGQYIKRCYIVSFFDPMYQNFSGYAENIYPLNLVAPLASIPSYSPPSVLPLAFASYREKRIGYPYSFTQYVAGSETSYDGPFYGFGSAYKTIYDYAEDRMFRTFKSGADFLDFKGTTFSEYLKILPKDDNSCVVVSAGTYEQRLDHLPIDIVCRSYRDSQRFCNKIVSKLPDVRFLSIPGYQADNFVPLIGYSSPSYYMTSAYYSGSYVTPASYYAQAPACGGDVANNTVYWPHDYDITARYPSLKPVSPRSFIVVPFSGLYPYFCLTNLNYSYGQQSFGCQKQPIYFGAFRFHSLILPEARDFLTPTYYFPPACDLDVCKSDLSAKKTVIQQEAATLLSGLTNSPGSSLPCYPLICLTGKEAYFQPFANGVLLLGSMGSGFILFRRKKDNPRMKRK